MENPFLTIDRRLSNIEDLLLRIKNPSEPSFPSPEEELLSADEACEVLKCSRPTLWRYEKEGKVKGYGIGGKRYYKQRELLESLIEKK